MAKTYSKIHQKKRKPGYRTPRHFKGQSVAAQKGFKKQSYRVQFKG